MLQFKPEIIFDINPSLVEFKSGPFQGMFSDRNRACSALLRNHDDNKAWVILSFQLAQKGSE